MPELPEVEVVRQGLQPWTVGRRIQSVTVQHPRSVRRHQAGASDFTQRLIGRRLERIDRRGKFMWWQTDQDEALIAHLGMSGQFRVVGGEHNARHERIAIEFEDAQPGIVFVDQRTFGGLCVDELITVDSSQMPSSLQHIARDPFDDRFDPIAVAHRMKQSRSSVKAVLLDQRIVSGVGNIYADESLWRAQLCWSTPANRIRVERLHELLDHASDVMTQALAAGGTSFDELYVNVNGSSGYFERSLDAYGRAGRPCRRCGELMVKEQFGNRSSVRCPNCQRRR